MERIHSTHLNKILPKEQKRVSVRHGHQTLFIRCSLWCHQALRVFVSSHCEKHLAKSGSGHKVSGPITNLEDDLSGWGGSVVGFIGSCYCELGKK